MRFLQLLLLLALAATARADAPKDRHGDPLPEQAVSRLGSIRFVPGARSISQLAYSPDGKLLASLSTSTVGSVQQGIQIWDVNSGREVGPPALDGLDILDMAWSPDSRQMVIGTGSGTVAIWNIVAKKLVDPLWQTEGKITAVAWSKDGQWIAAGMGEGHTLLWKASDRTRWSVIQQPAYRIAFSADSKSLAVAGKGAASIWNVAIGKRLLKLEGEWKRPYTLEFSPNGTALALAAGEVYVFDLKKSDEEPLILGEEDKHKAFTVTYSPDGELLATSGFSSVHLWEATTGKLHQRLFDLNSGCGLAFAPDGKTIATPSHRIRFVDVATLGEIERFHSHRGYVSRLIFSADGTSVYSAGGNDGTIRKWKAHTGEQSQVYRMSNRARFMSVSHDEKMMAVPWGESILLIDPISGLRIARLEGHKEDVIGVQFSPVNNTLVSQSTGATIFWNAESRRQLGAISWDWGEEVPEYIRFPAWMIRFSPNGEELAVGWPEDFTIDLIEASIFDVKTQRKLRGLPAAFNLGGLLFNYSPDGSQYATIRSGILQVRDSKTGKLIWNTKPGAGENALPFAMAWSPDAKFIAVADWAQPEIPSAAARNFIHIYSASSGKQLAEYRGHSDFIKCLAFSPDSSLLASGSQDTTVLLWDLALARKAITE